MARTSRCLRRPKLSSGIAIVQPRQREGRLGRRLVGAAPAHIELVILNPTDRPGKIARALGSPYPADEGIFPRPHVLHRPEPLRGVVLPRVCRPQPEAVLHAQLPLVRHETLPTNAFPVKGLAGDGVVSGVGLNRVPDGEDGLLAAGGVLEAHVGDVVVLEVELMGEEAGRSGFGDGEVLINVVASERLWAGGVLPKLPDACLLGICRRGHAREEKADQERRERGDSFERNNHFWILELMKIE